jgi:DNA repair protein RecO (recombination protein O)
METRFANFSDVEIPRGTGERPRMRTTAAILIRLTKLTETSLIAHWFTADCGLVKTVAKGARRPKSPFSGKLDLFFGGEIAFAPARRGELHGLREAAISEWREGLRRNYDSVLLAAYFCQLLEAAVEPEHPVPELHDLLRRALDHLEAAPAGTRALRHFESELARLLGVAQSGAPAHAALRDALGNLPAARGEVLERLAAPSDFRSSDPAIDR